ncbi:MAG TPA: LPS export ABC transporter periplasmic protein LptC [Sphingomonadaceae bacterium]|nr:LPS export ABC transporter periplasmic protein LptC [Sphingomonadaceae bacterium]
MSEAAAVNRAERQLRAAPGGQQDRVLRFVRVGLPMAAGVLVAVLAMAPLSKGNDISFLLDKNKVDVAAERMRASSAQYRGMDDRGRPFHVAAGSAVQRTSADAVVRLNDIAARMQLPDGQAAITAGRGRYDMIAEQVGVDGPVQVSGPGGYALETRDVTVDMKTRTMGSAGPVEGRMPLGTFSAGRLRADLGERHVVLDGGARLKIVQGALK